MMNRSNLAHAVPPPDPRQSGAVDDGRRRQAKPVAAARTPRRRQNYALIVIVVALLAVNVAGAPYYLLPMAERVRHPLHQILRPSGAVGQSAGLLAFAIFVFLWLYPVRKRFRALAFLGSVGRWLDVHVTAAFGLPLLLAIHAAWRFDGVIGLGYLAILIVWASGVVGRYLYTRIPRTRTGVELSLEEVTAQRRALILEISAATGLASEDVEHTLDPDTTRKVDASPLRVLGRLVTNDFRRWRRTRQLRARWAALVTRGQAPDPRALRDIIRLANREISLAQQSRMLESTHRVFRYWHVAHRPVAITALAAVIILVVVVVALGATWLW